MSNSVSLYIHIPFCKKKCAYCDFFSKPCANFCIPDQYIDALLREAEFYSKKYKITSWKTVYVGGGTPSLLKSEQIRSLFIKLQQITPFAPNAEVTMEANPDDITADFLEALSFCGVNRLSVGVQSLNDSVLNAINRRCTRKTTLNGLDLIKQHWKHRFSVDVISGLPKADDSIFLETLKTLVFYNPDHISLYSLTLEEGTVLGDSILSGKQAYDYDAADNQWVLGRDFLEQNNYFQYEVSNFSKKGYESAHNKTYWHLEDYVGIGSGASGTMHLDTKDNHSFAERWTNRTDIDLYTDFWTQENNDYLNIPKELEELTLETQEFEFLMMGFRLLEGVSDSVYKSRFNKDLAERLGCQIGGLFSSWEEKGLARQYSDNKGMHYALNAKGILFLNSFLESLL